MAVEMTFDELLNEMGYSTDDQVILKSLLKNNWKIKETAQELHHGKRMISKYRKEARHDIPAWLWQQKGATLRDIEQIANIEHHTSSKVLKPLGYDSKAHYHTEENPWKLARQRFAKELGQKYANNQSLNADNLDAFLMAHRGGFAYDFIKKALYQANPALQQRMYHQKTKVSPERLAEIKSNDQARTTFYHGLQLDFPEYTAIQLRMLYENDYRYSNSMRHYREPSDKEKQEIIANYVNGKMTPSAMANTYNLSFKAIMKVLNDANVSDAGQTAQRDLHRQLSQQSLNQIGPEEEAKRRRATHQTANAKARVPHDYLSSILQWAWDLVDAQPDLLWFDKIYSFFHDKQNVLRFIAEANKHAEIGITLSDLDEIFPSIPYTPSPSQIVYRNFAQDQDIKRATIDATDSHYEMRLGNVLDQLGIEYSRNNRRVIAPYELDFYLPEQRIAFEISPIRTHNSNRYQRLFADPKPARYHYHKYRQCQDQGIKLITLFQDALDDPAWTTITKPMLRFLITGHATHTYYARNTDIRPITKPEARIFLNKWHLNGASRGRFAYGVYAQKSSKLLGVAMFGTPMAPKYKQVGYLELKRLAWRSDVQVRYGLSKLVTRAQHDYQDKYTGILSYSDNNIGDGSSYRKAGFQFVRETGPQLTFVNPLHAEDHYSWSIATPWGAKSGVLAKALGPQDVTGAQARKLVETVLPHQADSKTGYAAQYDTGNKVWLKTFR